MLFWGAPHGSPNPGPISDQKKVIFHTSFQNLPLKPIPVFRHGGGHKRNIHVYIDRNCVIRLRLGRRQQEDFLKSILISHSTLSYSFGIETTNTFIPSRIVVPSNTLADSRPKWAKPALYLFSAKNGSKTIPFGVPPRLLCSRRL